MNQTVQNKVTTFFNTGREKSYPKGAILTLAGSDPEGVSLLVSGIVEQYDITGEGNKSTVNLFKPQAFFPMSWAINKTPNTYFFAAQTDVVVRIVDGDKVVEFLRSEPDVLFDLLSRVYKGTDALLRQLVVATNGAAAQRLIYELLIAAYRFGSEVSETTRQITVKQSHLAARTGLARETVSRELHKLEIAQLLTLTKTGIIVDVSGLERALE